jgi:hypothetical protein
MSVLSQIQRRAAGDTAFGNEIRTAMAHGDLSAAAGVARVHGFEVPALTPTSSWNLCPAARKEEATA